MWACDRAQKKVIRGWVVLVGSLVLSLLLTGCGATGAGPYTIGMVNYTPPMESVVEGFKAGMAELGYVEGEDVIYIYHGVIKNDSQVISDEIKSLLAQDVDLMLTIGTPTTVAAKQAVDGTKIPVIFAPVIDPVGEGVVESISRPGGNVTGVQSGNTIAKALEWLLKVAPAAKTVYVPYSSEDRVALTSIAALPEAASTLGVELMLAEVPTPDEAAAAIKTLSKDYAIFLVPTPRDVSGIIQAAKEQGLPVGAYSHDEGDILVTYTTNTSLIGKQAARLADQTLRGTAPADLPVETAEYFLIINLKAAQAIGLGVSDELLQQADTVIR